MICRLRGTIVESGAGRAVLDVGGVGYEVHVPESVMVNLPPIGLEATLIVRQTFREDGSFLYGFTDATQRRLFDLLTDVKGCGPKTALSVIGEIGEASAVSAIIASDSRTLTRANGVGPRLAERIIVELRAKLEEEQFAQKIIAAGSTKAVASISTDDELIDALLALGYRRQEAEMAANEARAQSEVVADQIRIALQVLRK